MEKITGYIDHIIFRNEENGYTVFQFHNENGEVTCVGKFPYIGDGEFLELEGEYVMHPSYGLQLQVTGHKVKEPEDRESIERYLGSGAVKGIGPALAGKIVAKFGEDTFCNVFNIASHSLTLTIRSIFEKTWSLVLFYSALCLIYCPV